MKKWAVRMSSTGNKRDGLYAPEKFVVLLRRPIWDEEIGSTAV